MKDPTINFREGFQDQFKSLETKLPELRDKLCEEIIDTAITLNIWDIDATICVRKRHKMPKELVGEVGLSAESKIT